MPFSSSVLGTLAPLKLCHGYACPSQALSSVRLPFSSSVTGALALLKLRLWYACPLKLCHGCACPIQALPRVCLPLLSLATSTLALIKLRHRFSFFPLFPSSVYFSFLPFFCSLIWLHLFSLRGRGRGRSFHLPYPSGLTTRCGSLKPSAWDGFDPHWRVFATGAYPCCNDRG